MSAMTNLQPFTDGTAAIQAPLLTKKKAAAKKKVTPSNEPDDSVVVKLAELRARYLPEMQAARDKIKKNFLR
jgi:hypothetical protein